MTVLRSEATIPPTERLPGRFRGFMAGFPSGVAIITATDRQGKQWGMTCSAMCSASVEPPTLIIGVRAASPTLRALLDSGSFAVNLLHERARETAELFASGDPDRFDLVAWEHESGYGGAHLYEAAHSVADCRVSQSVLVGPQRMVFGEPFRISTLTEARPLLYGMRRYGRWSAAG
ncbi:flavin reductase family protein [Nonomuraea guangzhouensis]|uniref:Flavin reductase family protein n=1 Tax=Nonomuraea guangzhouensis TaxID=1291555 RepID=A0ABW4GYM7_9ACTN|nr:flavin reductase family protein [Nonomuraea guangzhouensis]